MASSSWLSQSLAQVIWNLAVMEMRVIQIWGPHGVWSQDFTIYLSFLMPSSLQPFDLGLACCPPPSTNPPFSAASSRLFHSDPFTMVGGLGERLSSEFILGHPEPLYQHAGVEVRDKKTNILLTVVTCSYLLLVCLETPLSWKP